MTETTPAPQTPATPAGPAQSFVLERPIQTVGRRKEAVVRVRLVPGTGKFDLNGRSLEDYFPNKVHQQLIKAPLVTWIGWKVSTSLPTWAAAARRVRPARCAWVSPGH